MSAVISIHSENPQSRFIKQVIDILERGGVIAYPTDSGYALGCTLGNKKAMDQIVNIRKLSKHHHFTLMLKDLSHVGEYAKLNNAGFTDKAPPEVVDRERSRLIEAEAQLSKVNVAIAELKKD